MQKRDKTGKAMHKPPKAVPPMIRHVFMAELRPMEDVLAGRGTAGDLKQEGENSRCRDARNKGQTMRSAACKIAENHHADADSQHQFRSIQKNGSEGQLCCDRQDRRWFSASPVRTEAGGSGAASSTAADSQRNGLACRKISIRQRMQRVGPASTWSRI